MIINDWKLDYEDNKGLVAKLPCSLYSVLLKYNLIEHPYYKIDEQDAFKLSRKDCVFYADFEVSEEDYQKNAGASFEKVLEFLEYLGQKNIPTWIRQVIIPDLNDSEDNILKLKEIACKYSNGKSLVESTNNFTFITSFSVILTAFHTLLL